MSVIGLIMGLACICALFFDKINFFLRAIVALGGFFIILNALGILG